ncbi:hypothetical protein, partial [Qipengyuania algicida]|uniref:hypothetical protein n=1 Tax=Qipengyuania algicida TaxID=1836209 RepID=UPI001F483992
ASVSSTECGTNSTAIQSTIRPSLIDSPARAPQLHGSAKAWIGCGASAINPCRAALLHDEKNTGL